MHDSTPGRVRGRRGQRIRAQYLQLHPLCVMCLREGRTTPADEVDHVIPLFKGGEDTDDNKAALCKPCHKAKTRDDLSKRPRIAADGWPVGG